jgi:4'-phosphopantetheinyl transferase
MTGKITCQRVEEVNWIQHLEPFDLPKENVHVWRINHVANDGLVSNYEHLLNATELEKANRFFKIEDKRRYIITRAALRIILSKYLQIPAENVVFEAGENKKPQLAGISKRLCFNVSHSGNYSLIGISKFDLGVDIEFINNQFIYADIVNNYFNKKEADFITSSLNPKQFFFNCWTRKEAILKAISTGLNGPIQSIPCTDGGHVVDSSITGKNWVVKTFGIDPIHVGSVAFDECLKTIIYLNFEHSI